MNKVHKSSSRLLISVMVVLIVAIILTGLFHFVVFRPQCLTLTVNQPQQMNYQSNQGLINVAHGLGAKDPIQSCSGDIGSLLSFDGYRAYVIKIIGSEENQVRNLGCPTRPLSDQSNSQKVTYAHQAYRNRDKITGYYSPEGAKCSGGDLDIVMTALNNKNQSEVYVVYTARPKSQ